MASRASRARFMVQGGVNGTMFLGSAAGRYPYAWYLRAEHARRWEHREHAQAVADEVGGVVIDRADAGGATT